MPALVPSPLRARALPRRVARAARAACTARAARAARAVAAAAAGGALALAAVPAPATAAAAGAPYVALGDSYSSGTGTRSYLDDGTDCLRSAYAYPSLVAAAQGHALELRACSGATVADVAALQLDALGPQTAYVTLTVGGNDAGFADVLTECAQPAWMSDCAGAVDAADRVITGTLPARLSGLLADVRARAPQARVVVAGYPRLFNGVDCNALTFFSPQEQTRLNATADLLGGRLAAAAAGAGATYAPATAFVGHAWCSSAAWVNGLSVPLVESYHPNRAGHASGYAPTVGALLTGTRAAVSARTVRRAAAAAPALTERARRYAARDRQVQPARIALPDLDSPRARAAARRAGVDLASRASVEAAERRYARAQAPRVLGTAGR